jgi:hypothetical protein
MTVFRELSDMIGRDSFADGFEKCESRIVHGNLGKGEFLVRLRRDELSGLMRRRQSCPADFRRRESHCLRQCREDGIPLEEAAFGVVAEIALWDFREVGNASKTGSAQDVAANNCRCCSSNFITPFFGTERKHRINGSDCLLTD